MEQHEAGAQHETDTTSWHSYPKVYALGHAAIRDLFLDEVHVEEKVDGSQFSFGRFGDQLRIRSRGQEMPIDAPESMFAKAAHVVREMAGDLVDGWTYRGEYLQKPHHNALAYDRVPRGHVILFDINTGHETYASRDQLEAEALRLGLEVVPLVYAGRIEDAAFVRALMDRVSVLGGQKIEGLVVKNHKRFGPDGKALMGKFVSESFKEVHGGEWRKSNPTNGDVLAQLIEKVRTPARWQKAVQHLKESGRLEGSPRDIGALLTETKRDVDAECATEIKDALYEWAKPHILRGSIAGLPDWYKARLLEQQFAPTETSQAAATTEA